MSKNWVWTLSQLRIVDFAIGESEWHNKWQKLIRGDSNLVSRAFSFSDRTHNIGKNPGNEVAGILKNNGRLKKNQEKTRGEGRRGRLFGTRDGTNICVIINIFHSKKFGLDWKNNKKNQASTGLEPMHDLCYTDAALKPNEIWSFNCFHQGKQWHYKVWVRARK